MEGMWENILRNHKNSFKSLFHRSKPSSPDANTADDIANSPKIPQLSTLANSCFAVPKEADFFTSH
ncbi:unnamed protein product [Sphenostylis stenocarpa]|uniref:Uncharacterized protein n=1 Tax=Sphenostylis stenocarpa TaxID=92480 RepID=A0AA86W337_9FABA|nr:unnamed protein product [Sphenostylis stenocarpa]